jgi:hypothetical protein
MAHSDIACEVAVLVRAIMALSATYEANEEQRVELSPDEPARLLLEGWNERIAYRMRAIERAVALQQARSLEEGMFQIMLARAEAEYLWHLAADEHTGEATQVHGRIDGLLYSVLRLLEELTGTPAEALGADYYMRREQDPHAGRGATRDGS